VYAYQKPTFPYRVVRARELRNLEQHRADPERTPIPSKTRQNILIASWNIANFGLQERERVHIKLIADIIRPFDVVAVQEVADDLEHFHLLVSELGGNWDYIYTDIAGNNERAAFLYDLDRVVPTGLAAELAMRGYQRTTIVIEDVEVPGGFPGFNRNPYIVGFAAGNFQFFLVNVHLYQTSFAIRQLETMALGQWAKRRVGKDHPPNNDIILIGDFNMPRVRPGDKIYDQAAEYGLTFPAHTTNLVGTNLAGDSDFDQLAFFPSRTTEDFTNRMGVFDFDNALFKDLYQRCVDEEDRAPFFQYCRYYISDHRPLWAEFRRT
jgi:endonuclease/exonuclease/phosphatase family metal-dependent hydrolase